MSDPVPAIAAVALDPAIDADLDAKGYTGAKVADALQTDLTKQTGEKGWYCCPGYDERNGFVFFARRKDVPEDLNTLKPVDAKTGNAEAVAVAWIAEADAKVP